MSEIYPAIEKAFNMFTAELLTIYIEKLEELNKYDSSKIFKYDLTRSVELLKNLELVPDKKLIIKKAFETCPYNADVYEAVIDCGLFDVESLITAKKFHQEKILENKIENLAKLSLDDKAVVEEYIIVLANYWECDEKTVLQRFYSEELKAIDMKYQELKLFLCYDKKKIRDWIVTNIGSDLTRVLKITEDEVEKRVSAWIKNDIDNECFKNMFHMGLVSIEDIKLKDSCANTLAEVQGEYLKRVVNVVVSYIKIMNQKKEAYEIANEQYKDELKEKQRIISEKRVELAGEKRFASSKKEELRSDILQLEKELDEYQKLEPIHLKKEYLEMFDESLAKEVEKAEEKKQSREKNCYKMQESSNNKGKSKRYLFIIAALLVTIGGGMILDRLNYSKTSQSKIADHDIENDDEQTTNLIPKASNTLDKQQEQKEAIESAKKLIDNSKFLVSYNKIIDNLEQQGYDEEIAIYGADNCGVDWDKEALRVAHDLIDNPYLFYSYDKLVEELSGQQGFSKESAIYGADNCGADWKEQAIGTVQQTLDTNTGESYKGMLDLLEYLGFTNEEAEYAVKVCNIDWNEQAVLQAKLYLQYGNSGFSKDKLIEELETNGFTHEQAVYGVEQAGV